MAKREFEFSDGKSEKFWNVELVGSSHTVHYGRKGTKGQTRTKDFATPEAAQKSYDKLITQKTKKGYVEVCGGGAAVLAPPETKDPSEPKAPQKSEMTAKSGNTDPMDAVRWDQIKWKEVNPRRCDGHRVKLPKAEVCWKQIIKKCNKYRSAIEGHDFAPQGQDMPERPLDPQKEHRLAKTIAYNEWKGSPPSGFMGYWFAHEGPVFCLEILLNNTDLFDGWGQLRRFMAALDEDTYAQTLAWARESLQREFRTAPRQAEIRLAFSFPDQLEWNQQVVDKWLSTQGEYRPEILCLLASPPTLEKLPQILNKLPHNCGWQDVARHYLVDLIVLHGALAVPALLEMMLKGCRTGGEQKVFAKALALVKSAEVAKFFAGQLKDKDLREVATTYLKQCPVLAAPALAEETCSAARQLLGTLEVQTVELEEASLGELPAVLADPPWKREKVVAAEIPVVAGLEVLPFQEEVLWSPGEREEVVKAYRERQNRPWRARPEDATKEALSGGELYDYLMLDVREDVFLELWREMDVERWNVAQMDTNWDARVHFDVLALFGADAIEGSLPFAAVNAKVGLPPLERVRSPRVAALMVPHLAKRTKLRAVAVSWLRSHPEAAAIGLLPVALGPKGKERDAARAGLDILRGLGHTEQIRRVASEYGPEATKATEVLLSADLLLACPKNVPKRPKFLQPKSLPRPLLKSGKAVSSDAVEDIVSMLAFSQADPPYLGITQVKEACQPDSLADFAWDLMEACVTGGGSTASNWALFALGHLGNNGTARKLASIIRRWQGEKQKARVAVGLEVLGLIGTDVALVHLSRFATKGVSTKLREAAQAELDKVARRRGMSRDELADRTAPDLGLDDDGGLVLELGARTLQVSFDENLKPRLRDAQGWVARFPRAGRDDDKDKIKAAGARWKELVKDAESVASGQVARLEQAMCRWRRWSSSEFLEFLVSHPLLGHLTRRLIWATYDQDGKVTDTFRVTEDRSLADLEDEEWTLPSDACVGIPHPVECETLAQWGPVLADYEMLQPFSQFDREVFRFDPDYSVEGLKVPAEVLLSLNRLGWRLDHDSVSFSEYIKEFAGGGWASIDFSPGLDGHNFAGSGEQTLGYLRFSDKATDVDAVEYSELIRDLEGLRL
jgi:predicted DNA-binding WGR domain protein